MKPNMELGNEYFSEGLGLLNTPKKYDRAIHLLNKAHRLSSFYATYVLAGELSKEKKLYPADPERSRLFYKKALPFLEIVPESDPDYLRARHYLATYYIFGYGDIERDVEKGLNMEEECNQAGFPESMKFLRDYYLFDENLNFEKSHYYSELYDLTRGEEAIDEPHIEEVESDLPTVLEVDNIAEREELWPGEPEESLIFAAEISEDPCTETVSEEPTMAEVSAEDILLPVAAEVEERRIDEPKKDAIDASKFFVTDEERERQETNWQMEVAASLGSQKYDSEAELEIPSSQLTAEERLARALNIFEGEQKARYDEAIELLGSVSSAYPIQVNCYLGDLFNTGLKVEADPLKAIHYFSLAHSYNSIYASYQLGLIYFSADPEETFGNRETGLAYLKESALAGYAPALFELGEIYFYGRNGLVNKKAARRFYELAQERGYALDPQIIDRAGTEA